MAKDEFQELRGALAAGTETAFYSVVTPDLIAALLKRLDAAQCRHPQCLENEDERCARRLTGECAGPASRDA